MKRYGLIFNAYYKVKEANLKRLHTVWFQLHDILEKAKQWREFKKSALGVEGMKGRKWVEHRIFRTMKLLCMIPQWWTHMSKPIECTTPRRSPNVNYTPCKPGWVIVGSSGLTNVSLWWQILGRLYKCRGRGHMGKLYSFPSILLLT